MRTLVLMIVAGALTGCNYSGPQKHTAPIGANAVIVMTPAQFPDMYANLGPAEFARANALSKAAARKGASDRACDRVDMVSVSFLSVPSNLTWLVDCTNGARLFIDDVDLR